MEQAIIALFIILILFIVLVSVLMSLTKTFVDKSNILYFVPLLIITTALFSIGYKYEKGFYDTNSFFDCLVASLKAFGFEAKREYIGKLAGDNVIYKITVYTAVVLCGATTVSTILSFVKVFVFNAFGLFKRIFRKTPDFVFGTSEETIEFATKNKNCILLVDKNDPNVSFDNEKKKQLFINDVVYLRTPFTPKKLAKLVKFTKGTVHLFFFDHCAENLNVILDLIKNSNIKNEHHVSFHVAVNDDNMHFVNKQLTEACAESQSRTHISACSFNVHHIMGRRLCEGFNFAKYLPRDFLHEGAVLPQKHIKVVFLGAGRTTNAALESCILNNQFVTIVENGKKYQAKPVEYIIYDVNSKAFEKRLIKLFKEPQTSIELPAKIETREANIKTDVINSLDSSLRPDSNTFVFYFVDLDNTLDNLTIANSIIEQVDHSNCLVLYSVHASSEVVPLRSPKILPFGFKYDVLTRENIIDAKYNEEAAIVNGLYNKLKGDNRSFTTLHIIEKLSNVYADINVEFKLNLIGLTLQKQGEPLDAKTYQSVYRSIGGKSDYFSLCSKNALRYQEHLRWSVYYYLNGFRIMPHEQIKLDGKGSIVHKDLSRKMHACLVPYYELDELHKFEAKLSGKKWEDVETYKYDTQILDNLINETPVYWLEGEPASIK